jgi:hypothetical protein
MVSARWEFVTINAVPIFDAFVNEVPICSVAIGSDFTLCDEMGVTLDGTKPERNLRENFQRPEVNEIAIHIFFQCRTRPKTLSRVNAKIARP